MEFLNRPVSNYGTASWLCGLIGRLRFANPLSTCIAYVEQETGPTSRYKYEPATEWSPAWFAVRFEERILVVIDGASTLAQLQHLVDSYTGVLQSGFRDPDNVYLQSAADDIVRKLRAEGMTDTQTWSMAGWSLGGAIATLMPANESVKPWFDNSVEVVSFGAPRPGGESVARVTNARMRLVRYMNDTDPIPLSPTKTDIMPSLPLMIGVRPALRWSNFVQPSGGIELDFDGRITPSAVPRQGVVSYSMNLAAWMWGFYSGDGGTHALAVYGNRLFNASQRERNHSLPRPAGVEPVNAVGRAEVNRQARQAEQLVINIEHAQNQVQENIPKVERFAHIKVGPLHYVTFRGTPIGTTRSKRKAIAMAREMNSALQRLQRMALVDTAAFGQEWQHYLEEASDPAGTFSPVMRTNWNVGVLP